MKRVLLVLSLVVAIGLSGCAALPGAVSSVVSLSRGAAPLTQAQVTPTPAPSTATTQETAPTLLNVPAGIIDLQDALANLYEVVSPSIVNITVRTGASSLQGALPDIPEHRDVPDLPGGFGGVGVGSGFVWDAQGHIVTNNHVVDGATQISVTFSDGLTLSAELVGTDRDSDLAVVKVDPKKATGLRPVTVGDSTQVKVGQFVVAIGNPFGLEGSMTFGIVSALGRSLPVSRSQLLFGGSYSIPDVIQTDAPVNPGNSGGALLDMTGRLVGVPTAIESSTNSSAGVGFAVPSVIVRKVVPELISSGEFKHPYIGISGATLTSAIADAMDLPASTRGVLIDSVTKDSPAEKAGLKGSTETVKIDGFDAAIGGDVITAVDGQAIRDFEDLTTFLARKGRVGQDINLTILRDGAVRSVTVTLAERPAAETVAELAQPETTPESRSAPQASGGVYLGVTGMTVTPALAQALDLGDRTGVLVVEVVDGSPAAEAGLRGSDKPLELNGEQLMVGGDVIIKVDGAAIAGIEELVSAVQSKQAGDEISVTFLRSGEERTVTAQLANRSGTAPRSQPVQPRATPKSSATPEAQGNNAPAARAAFLGVNGVTLPAEMAQFLGLGSERGVLVLTVVAGSPAEKAGVTGAGLSRGRGRILDADVILAVDGKAVTSIEELTTAIQKKQPGDEIQLTVARAGEKTELAVTLGEQPAD